MLGLNIASAQQSKSPSDIVVLHVEGIADVRVLNLRGIANELR